MVRTFQSWGQWEDIWVACAAKLGLGDFKDDCGVSGWAVLEDGGVYLNS